METGYRVRVRQWGRQEGARTESELHFKVEKNLGGVMEPLKDFLPGTAKVLV